MILPLLFLIIHLCVAIKGVVKVCRNMAVVGAKVYASFEKFSKIDHLSPVRVIRIILVENNFYVKTLSPLFRPSGCCVIKKFI